VARIDDGSHRDRRRPRRHVANHSFGHADADVGGPGLPSELKKWLATFRIELVNVLTYRLNFLLTILVPALVFFLVNYNIWTSIFLQSGLVTIGGYTLTQMIAYQACVLVVRFLSQEHNGRNLAEEIRLGRISSFLLYPFHFSNYQIAGFFAFQSVQIVGALLIVIVLFALGFGAELSTLGLVQGLFLAILVALFWFSLQFSMATLAFWLEETWVLRVIFQVIAALLSGAVMPLSLFPESLRTVLWYTPFPYLTAVPVELMLGRSSVSFETACLAVLFWAGCGVLLARTIWRRGMSLYSAAGM